MLQGRIESMGTNDELIAMGKEFLITHSLHENKDKENESLSLLVCMLSILICETFF